MIPSADVRHLWERIRRSALHQCYLDVRHNPEDSLILAGSGRSGTTWLAAVVNHANTHRYMFEPFRSRPAIGNVIRPRQYLRPGEETAVAPLIESVLAGKMRERWVDQHNRRILARRRLIKDIWILMMLGWIRDRYPSIPVVLMIRHPCAVVRSQIILRSWKWQADVRLLTDQPDLMNDVLGSRVQWLPRHPTPFEDHLWTWAVENYVALAHIQALGGYVVFYEELCRHPEEEAGTLLDHLGLPSIGDPTVLYQPSFAVRRESGSPSGGRSSVGSWMQELSQRECQTTQEVLEIFGLDKLYSAENPLPLVSRSVLDTSGTGPVFGAALPKAQEPIAQDELRRRP